MHNLGQPPCGHSSGRSQRFFHVDHRGVSTDYMAFVEKRQIASLSSAKRSNNYANNY